MPRLRRVTAALATLLLIHAVWTGNGSACALPAAAHSVSAMEGMDMTSAGIAGMDMGAGVQPTSDSPMHDGAECTLPWATDNCQSMALCLPLGIAADASAIDAIGAGPSSMALLVVLTPPSRSNLPELPPPRA